MRVVVSAGGTGGHIYPALAIIEKIKAQEPNSEFLYIGTHNRMEKDIVPNRGIPFKSIEMYGFNKKNLLKNFKTVKCIFKGFKDCKKMIKEFNPDVVIGVGGYVTVPVIISAKKLGYKTFIHEQNSIPGKANRYLSKYCDLIGVSFKSSMEYLPKEKTILTGNPCSEHAIEVPAATKTELGLSSNKKLVLITMGSLGSKTVNEVIVKTMDKFKNKNYEVLYITGKAIYDKVKDINLPKNVKILPFYENLVKIMKRADLMITRAGASTLSELIALEVPSILIPSPFVANNHQYINALDLIDNDAALMIEEKDLTPDTLIDKIDEIIEDSVKLKVMKNNLDKLKVNDSSLLIYNKLRELNK
ncbi:MAG: undecaprenyldiphospho-muramoylpentapeptide beta-N-acetylglucosaminyltransferase [Bacilli bacterium]|nr:undecaprenyldiphospho-muramoylpentapeptide beta-N-acetylglucosaminyltransferase [Bacilli bacterium]